MNNIKFCRKISGFMKAVLSGLLLLTFFSTLNFAQLNDDRLLQNAVSHMDAGRYGEAIDLLNKYISSNPRNPEGYNLRGLSFEKRQQYGNAASDLRIARKLEPYNIEYRRNYARITEVWHKLLYKTIEGRKREIAINPSNAENYLEIGKAYKGLEDWAEAESWYDEYLKRDDNASPDEIIRYTEILMMTKNLSKGEKILKTYVDRYPDDWRLWSRYGYFTLWLGKYKTAEGSFEKALEFKPFFKEAEEGLDLAKKKGYIQPYVGGTQKAKVFLIDKYYRMLRLNPKDDKTRFLLVDELIKYKRIEEAYKQLQILQDNYEDDGNFKIKWQYVTDYRDREYQSKIDENSARMRKNPADKKALLVLIEYYGYREEYEDAVDVIEKYYAATEDDDPDLKYKYARFLSWTGDNQKAAEVMDSVLQKEPDNLDYQFFRAQLSVWQNRDLDVAEKYLENYIKKNPEDINALILLCSVKMSLYKLEEAENIIGKIKSLNGDEYEIENLESKLEITKLKMEEERTFGILQQGRLLVLQGNCEDAIPYYIDYIHLAGADSTLTKEFGDVYFCSKNYKKALGIYDSLLNTGYTYDVALQRGKVYYAMGDSINAVKEFKDIVNREPNDFEANLYLGDSYIKTEEYSEAEEIYDSLLARDLDSTQKELVLLRKGWIPAGTGSSLFGTFPQYAGLAPSLLFYSDNLSFRMVKVGARLEAGINRYISLGISLYQSSVKSETDKQNYTTMTGHIFIRPAKKVTLGFGYGGIKSKKATSDVEADAFLRYEIEDKIRLQGTFQRTSATLLMYSGNLIDAAYSGDMYKIDFDYYHKNGFILSGYYKYISLGDEINNQGNDFLIRAGKKLDKDTYRLGYEYYYSNYKINTADYYGSQLYYSPQNFESHCIWGEWVLERTDEYLFKLTGKAGYVPESEFIIREIGAEGKYDMGDGLNFNGKITLGSTSRDNSSYNFISGIISLYWNF